MRHINSLAIVGVLLASTVAHARRCADNPLAPSGMMDLVNLLSNNGHPIWSDTPEVRTGGPDMSLWPAATNVLGQYCTVCHSLTGGAPGDWTNPETVAARRVSLGIKLNSGLMPPPGSSPRTAWDGLTSAQRTQNINAILNFANSGTPVVIVSPFIPGVGQLFNKYGQCSGCHRAADASTPAGTGYKRYNGCFNCHFLSGSANKTNPEWLVFMSRAGLARTSYYYPGHSKAEAALVRARDGSMPPGAAAEDQPVSASDSVGWCDEIRDAFNLWIANGMPE